MLEKLWRYVKPFSYNTSVSRTDVGRTELLYQYRASAAVCWRATKMHISTRVLFESCSSAGSHYYSVFSYWRSSQQCSYVLSLSVGALNTKMQVWHENVRSIIFYDFRILMYTMFLSIIFTCVSYAEARNRYRLDVRPSVRLSVRPSHAGTVSKRLNVLSWFLYHTIAHSF